MFSIVIPIKNQLEILKKCIDSIVKHYSDQEIVLVDDASEEEELKFYLKSIKQEKGWKVIFLEKRLGPPALGGAEALKEAHSRHVCRAKLVDSSRELRLI